MERNRETSSEYADDSGDPKPPRRTLLDWFGIVICVLLGSPFVYVCACAIYGGIEYGQIPLILAGLLCAGPPGIACWWRAWHIFVSRKRNWRTSMRTRRLLCINCSYDLRGGVEICPECGTPVPEPIDRIAARLNAMTGNDEITLD